MFVVSFKKKIGDTLTYNDIPYGVMSGFILLTDQSVSYEPTKFVGNISKPSTCQELLYT
jgi:hypothetical protein